MYGQYVQVSHIHCIEVLHVFVADSRGVERKKVLILKTSCLLEVKSRISHMLKSVENRDWDKNSYPSVVFAYIVLMGCCN